MKHAEPATILVAGKLRLPTACNLSSGRYPSRVPPSVSHMSGNHLPRHLCQFFWITFAPQVYLLRAINKLLRKRPFGDPTIPVRTLRVFLEKATYSCLIMAFRFPSNVSMAITLPHTSKKGKLMITPF